MPKQQESLPTYGEEQNGFETVCSDTKNCQCLSQCTMNFLDCLVTSVDHRSVSSTRIHVHEPPALPPGHKPKNEKNCGRLPDLHLSFLDARKNRSTESRWGGPAQEAFCLRSGPDLHRQSCRTAGDHEVRRHTGHAVRNQSTLSHVEQCVHVLAG